MNKKFELCAACNHKKTSHTLSGCQGIVWLGDGIMCGSCTCKKFKAVKKKGNK